MARAGLIFFAALLWAGSVIAQPFGGLARLLPDDSRLAVSDAGVQVQLHLSQAVPFRVFTLSDPWRVVVDFREVAFDALPQSEVAARGPVTGVEAGRAVDPGWSRMVFTTDRPFYPESVAMDVDPATAAARLTLALEQTTAAEFLDRSAPLAQTGQRLIPTIPEATQAGADRLTVVLDPGHGGVDPGAVRGDVTEADLVLQFARELRDALRRTGQVDVVLTRDADAFVPLLTRVTIARAAEADALISIHADALAEGRARGATVYTLAERATDAAAAALAEQHDRADMLQGIDLQGTDDVVAGVLMDLARAETTPRSLSLANGLVAALAEAEIALHSRPRGEAGFTVLRAAEIPSTLLEIGFMSDRRDLENIQNPEWRATVQDALVAAILDWAEAEAARTALLRQ
ncbi:MAG: N-acetylmuramoyl-L-alanine amidase [Pseudomonadota bacterium]